MKLFLKHLRHLLRRIRRPTVHAERIAFKLQRAAVYGLDLVLWSRLFARRRGPVPMGLPKLLLDLKGVSVAPPCLHVSGAADTAVRWEEGFGAVNATLFLNLQKPDVLSASRYAHPSPAFKGVYLWDSAFIAQVWKWWDPAIAGELLQAVIDLRDGDRLQHVVADLVSSPYTQPPLTEWSRTRVDRLPGRAASRSNYEIARRYQEWLERERRHPGGLYFWEHCYESGVENSPRFSSRDESALLDTREMASPDLSTYIIVQDEALAESALRLGDEAAAAGYLEHAEQVRARMNSWLWHEEDSFYYDRRFEDEGWVRCRNIAGLLPLWAGVPDLERARILVEQAMDPKRFGTSMPLPSVAADDPSYELDMWRGPVWLNTAYGVILGIERYGFLREMAELSWRLCEGVYGTYLRTRRIYEFYDPDERHVQRLNRKLGNRWKKFTLGNKPRSEFVGWSGLANTLLIEHLVGVHPTDRGTLALRPCFPPMAAGCGFALRLPALQFSVQLEIVDEEGGTRGTVWAGGATHRFELAFGEVFEALRP